MLIAQVVIEMIETWVSRKMTSSSKYCHITPVLREVHWLPVRFRIHFKILLLTFKALNGMATDYIKELRRHVSYSLRSNSGITISNPVGKMLKSFGDSAFSVAAPTVWNALPTSLRNTTSLFTFKSCLKTYLFKLVFNV